MNQNTTLFGEKIIQSISFDEQEIINDILYLHCDSKPIELDPCYSTGVFYRQGLTQPKYKFDINPQSPGVIQASADDLPLESESVSIVMFDPPFLMGGTQFDHLENDESCHISRRFTAFQNFDQLKTMYRNSLSELHRVMKKNGILIFKCQDQVCGGKQYFVHDWVMNSAIKCGFYPKDLFILLSKNRMIGYGSQVHARKFHSYYWVLEKKRFRNEY